MPIPTDAARVMEDWMTAKLSPPPLDKDVDTTPDLIIKPSPETSGAQTLTATEVGLAGNAAQAGAAALSPLPQQFAAGDFGLQSYAPPAAPGSFDDLISLRAADEDKDSLTSEEVEKLLPGLPKEDPASFLARMDEKTLSNEEADQLSSKLDQTRKVNVGDALRQARPQQAPPPISTVPQTPDSMIRGAIGKFANPLMLMALTAGALTKQPALNALAAATGVLEGMNQKDAQKTYLQQNKFRNSVKQTLKQQGLEIADINSVLQSDADPATKIAQLDVLGQQYGDPIVSDLARKGDFKGLQEFMEGRQKVVEAGHKASRNYDKTSENVQKYAQQEESAVDLVGKGEMNPPPLNSAKNRDFMAKVMKKYPDYNPETDSPGGKKQAAKGKPTTATGVDYTQPLPPGLEERARSFAKGNWRAASGGARGDQDAIKNRGSWLADHPEAMQPPGEPSKPGLAEATKQFAGEMRAAQTAGSIEGRIVSALTRAQKTAPVVIALSNRVDRSQYPDLNAILLSGKQKIGNVPVAEFKTAVATFVYAYGQAIGGGVSGNITVDAAKDARTRLTTAFTKGQVEGTVRQMLMEIDRELVGSTEALKTASGTAKMAPKDAKQEAYEWAVQNLESGDAETRSDANAILKSMGL